MDINDLTYKINGAVYEVNRVLGSGFLEKVYENALIEELKDIGLKAENQVPINVKYKGLFFSHRHRLRAPSTWCKV
jgi:GxxExxY protein